MKYLFVDGPYITEFEFNSDKEAIEAARRDIDNADFFLEVRESESDAVIFRWCKMCQSEQCEETK